MSALPWKALVTSSLLGLSACTAAGRADELRLPRPEPAPRRITWQPVMSGFRVEMDFLRRDPQAVDILVRMAPAEAWPPLAEWPAGRLRVEDELGRCLVELDLPTITSRHGAERPSTFETRIGLLEGSSLKASVELVDSVDRSNPLTP